MHFINDGNVPAILALNSEYRSVVANQKHRQEMSSYADFAREHVGESIIRSMKLLPRFKSGKLG